MSLTNVFQFTHVNGNQAIHGIIASRGAHSIKTCKTALALVADVTGSELTIEDYDERTASFVLINNDHEALCRIQQAIHDNIYEGVK